MAMKASAARRKTAEPRKRARASIVRSERSSGKALTCVSNRENASNLRSSVDCMSIKTLGTKAGVVGAAYQFVSDYVS